MIKIKKALIKQKELVEKLMQLCIYDYSLHDNIDLNHKGQFNYKYLNYYWQDKNRFAYIIYYQNKIAGLILIRINIKEKKGFYNSIAEFFIANNYKRKGIGRKVIGIVFKKFKGHWKISYHHNNICGKKFWEKVVSEYTKNKYNKNIYNKYEILEFIV